MMSLCFSLLFPLHRDVSFFEQNDTSVRWLTNTLIIVHKFPPTLTHILCWHQRVNVCVYLCVCELERVRVRVFVHPPKLSISSCDLINNNTKDRVHDLHSAAACVCANVCVCMCVCGWGVATVTPLSTMRQTHCPICRANVYPAAIWQFGSLYFQSDNH